MGLACLSIVLFASQAAWTAWFTHPLLQERIGDVPTEMPLSSRQSIQWMLVDNEIDIKQSLWITLEAAAKAERGENFRKEAAMAKLVATEAAMENAAAMDAMAWKPWHGCRAMDALAWILCH